MFLTNGSFLGISGTTGGEISINANNLTHTERSNAIVGKENQIKIQADNNVLFDNNSLIITQVAENSQGNAGDIEIVANGNITFDNNSLILSQVEENSQGNAGDINLNANGNITFDRRSFIISGVNGQGDAGDINISAREKVAFLGTSDVVNGVALEGEPIEGNGGDIFIDTKLLELSSGSSFFSSSNGKGDAGNIIINASDGVFLSGADENNAPGKENQQTQLSVQIRENGEGNAGNVEINTGLLSLTDNSLILADTKGKGNAGNIDLTVTNGNIQLNSSQITASTVGRGGGGNINITTPQSVFLREGSQISTEASGLANGGDIKINADFVVAFPNQNNDIFTTATQGNGGRIDIEVESLLGIEERALNPMTNDISAKSEFGLDGTVSIDTPEVNSLRETTELSNNIVSIETIALSSSCSISETGEIEADGGLVVKGAGGLPPKPTDPFGIDVINVDGETSTGRWVYLPRTETGEIDFDKVIPARGVIFKEDGTPILTAYPTPGTPGYREYRKQMGCDL